MYRYFFLSLLFTYTLFASSLHINEADSYLVNNYLKYTLDNNNTINNLGNKTWFNSKKSFNTFENWDKAYWTKLTIVNDTNSTQQYYLQVENLPIYHMEFFRQHNNEIEYYEDGAIVKRPKRIFNNTHIIFPVLLEAHEETTIFLKIKNFNKVTIHFTLISLKYMAKNYPINHFLQALFFGAMSILMLYSLLLYIRLKHNFYLHYLLYTVSISFYFLGFFGYISAYFPQYIFLYHLSIGLIAIGLTLFMQSILHIKEKLPLINRLFIFISSYLMLSRFLHMYLLSIDSFFYAQLLFNSVLFFILTYILMLLLSTYYLAYSKQSVIAKVYAVIWSISLLFFLLPPLVYINILSSSTCINYLSEMVFLFEAVSFSFLLNYKIKLLEQEKEIQRNLMIKQTKMASMGEMISLITHQWKQPLSEINGIVMLMEIEQNKNKLTKEKLHYRLDQIEESTSYLAKTINDFMYLFSENKTLTSFPLQQAIKEALNLALISNTKTININYSKKTEVTLLGYKSELIQALLIVLNNAIEAINIQETKHPQIDIAITEKNSMVSIKIEDNAGGIDESILEKIFTPYFTTKQALDGTGLGLYILKIIIEESMHGKAYMYNGEKGAMCHIKIPKSLDVKKKI